MLAAALLLAGALLPLAAQTTAESPPAVAATPAARAVESKKKEHGFNFTFGDDSSDSEKESRSRFTPEQLYQLELARANHRNDSSLEDILVPVLVPSGFFLMIFGIVALTLWMRFRRQRMIHETVRLFAEKGQPLPPVLLDQSSTSLRPKSDLRRGITWSALGLGVMGYFLAEHDQSWGLGFIPLCLGLGYFLTWKLEMPRKPGAGV